MYPLKQVGSSSMSLTTTSGRLLLGTTLLHDYRQARRHHALVLSNHINPSLCYGKRILPHATFERMDWVAFDDECRFLEGVMVVGGRGFGKSLKASNLFGSGIEVNMLKQ